MNILYNDGFMARVSLDGEIVTLVRPIPRWDFYGEFIGFFVDGRPYPSGNARMEAAKMLMVKTGLTLDDLPDGLPLEEFINEELEFAYDGILDW